jgi:AraC family transcriptional regulator
MTVDTAQDPINPLGPRPSLSAVAPASARVGHLVMRAMALFESNRELAWRCLRDATTLLVGESAAIGTDAPPLQNILRRGGLAAWQAKRALQYIEDNLGSKMALQHMADSVSLSPSHFSRAFKQSLGSSPMAYVAAQRIERAKLMMTSTRERLTEIALACGFADQSHLTRSFSRSVGMSPRRWRRMTVNLPAWLAKDMTVYKGGNQDPEFLKKIRELSSAGPDWPRHVLNDDGFFRVL